MLPIQRRYTRALPLALAAFLAATDDRTNLTFTRTGPNQIVDVINSPDPAAGLTYVIRIEKGGVDTGVELFSEGLSAASAGRMAVGPIGMRGGDYTFQVAQTAGALAAYSFVVKYAVAPGA